MAGKVNRAIPIVCPGPESWERWEAGDAVIQASTSPDPGVWKDTEGGIIALPLRHALAIPLWLPAGEDRLSVAGLELEMRGVKKPDDHIPLEFCDVATVDGRSLSLAFIGSSHLPDGLIHPRAAAYEVRARLLPMQDNAVHFWKELGDWCFGLTHGPALVYAQSMGTPLLDAEAGAEIRRILWRLQSESVLTTAPVTRVWLTRPSAGEREAIAKALPGFTDREIPDAPPSLPESRIDLAPSQVQAARKARHSRGRLARIGMLAGCVYAIFLLFLIGRHVSGMLEIRKSEGVLAGQQEQMTDLMAISSRWNVMRPALDPTFYGLDLLFICAQMLPEKDVRLTAFALNGPRLQLSGEARTVPLAFEYIDRIKKNPDLVMYRWEAPQPTVLPNNSASFQIVGVRDDVPIIRK